MKKETVFILTMFVVGIIAGLVLVGILMTIAVPQFTQYQLTIAEKSDWDRIALYGSFVMGPASWMFYILSFAATVIVMYLFLGILNPQRKNVFKNWRSATGAKFIVALLLSLAWVYLLDDISGSFYISQKEISRTIQFCIYMIGTAGLWLVAGEQGWAGDYSSWGMSKDSQPVRASFFGAAAGSAIFAVVYLFDFASRKYFILVSEVFDGSGETSLVGFKQLALGSAVQFGLELSIIAGFVIALAPVQRDAAEVRHRLIKPIAALVAISVLMFAAYSYAGKRYDLDKPNLAAALGISDKAKDSKTILIFNPSKELPVTIQEWPLQTTAASLAVGGTIELTKDNLQKVESYLTAHPDGTIYTYAARNILMSGYYSLWDVEKGLTWQVKAAESQLISRLLLLARFSSMRVTADNLKLLESYSDEKIWHHSGSSARSLSMSYQHFGKVSEAKTWLRKAKDLGAEITDTKYFDVPAVTHGLIKGKIFLNGRPLSGIKVALLGQQTNQRHIDSYKLSDFSLARTLQEVVSTDKDGSFIFTSLGSAKYLIALMTEKNVIPFDVKPGKIKVNNVPELIQIGPVEKRDVGIISIITNL